MSKDLLDSDPKNLTKVSQSNMIVSLDFYCCVGHFWKESLTGNLYFALSSVRYILPRRNHV